MKVEKQSLREYWLLSIKEFWCKGCKKLPTKKGPKPMGYIWLIWRIIAPFIPQVGKWCEKFPQNALDQTKPQNFHLRNLSEFAKPPGNSREFFQSRCRLTRLFHRFTRYPTGRDDSEGWKRSSCWDHVDPWQWKLDRFGPPPQVDEVKLEKNWIRLD